VDTNVSLFHRSPLDRETVEHERRLVTLKIGNPTSRILAKAGCEMSRRDGAIVAWHEVPGTAPPQESRPVGYGVIRAGVRADSGNGHRIEQLLEHHRTRTFQEEYLASVKKHGLHFDEKYLWDSLRPIIPYPTGRFFRGTLAQALRARLRSVLSLRDTLAIF